MNIFEILGPVMVGPSSSHTAGAVRIGLLARQLLSCTPAAAEITLHGSFADTGAGHGTDRALVAGLLGIRPDDIRIPDSFRLAGAAGLAFTFRRANLRGAHPNTALLSLTAPSGRQLRVQCASVGGGRIRADKLDDIAVSFTGEHNTLLIRNRDVPGIVAEVSALMAGDGINIATLQLFRDTRGGTAVMVIEVDQPLPDATVAALAALDNVLRATYVPALD